ncbi:hypothetical protein CHRYSEOSP005_14620 [Chryseobacterium sp. Alg-005]|uniref:hypothetical protein n=1 Tax=Chryseobacterium sp. Alg-005 TaxID=3159516 RepID=UPI003555AD73
MTMKTTSHSETAAAFKAYMARWNDNVVTQDDIETQFIVREKLTKAFGMIEFLLNKSDEKAMIKARGNLIPGSREALDKEVFAMRENQKKSWYHDMKTVSNTLSYVRIILENVYEIKNRRSYECFKLRADNAKLRSENEKLREEISKLKNEKKINPNG